MLGNMKQSLLGTFGFMGIEEMCFRQTVLFLSAYFNTTMNITYTPVLRNAGDILQANLILAQLQPLVSTDFTSTFTFDSIPYPITLTDIGYDGSGGSVLASYLDCLFIHYEQ